MTAIEDVVVPVPASEAMVTLALVTRPDWYERDVRGAVAAAKNAGLTWAQVLAGMGRLMADPGARPNELIPDWRSPIAPVRPAGEDTVRSVVDGLHGEAWYRRAHPEGDRDGAA